MPLSVPLALALLLTTLAGCGSPVAPEGAAGRFVLETVDGEPLPAVMVTHDHGATYILADTVWLATDGIGERHTTYRTTDYQASNVYRSENPFTYVRDGTGIRITFDCNDVTIMAASCVAPPHMVGNVGATRMVLRDLHDNWLRYRRD